MLNHVMLDDFLLRAVLAGLGLVLATGPLGSFVVWRRMAYFGDSVAHAAILGVALALAFGVSVYFGTVAVAVLMAVGMAALSARGHSSDTILGVLSHGALAFGLVGVSLVPEARLDLNSFLFGDILAVMPSDLGLVWGGALIVLGVLVWRWQGLITSTVNEELAMASGIDPGRERLILSLALAVVVALSLRIVGALLMSALLIVPAAAARQFSRTPEAMAAFATLIGAGSIIGGVFVSLSVDVPTGPAIVCVAVSFFFISLMVRRR